MEGDVQESGDLHENAISIHSLRMEGDSFMFTISADEWISIHSLRMEGDTALWSMAIFAYISIHSLRMEGDISTSIIAPNIGNFNPLPPHGGRPMEDNRALSVSVISIHSLRMEGDVLLEWLLCGVVLFQSTPSAWRETVDRLVNVDVDVFQSTPSAWRETDGLWVMESRQDTFQSTPSAWRETHGILFCGNCGHHFNPLPPHGGRHYNREELIFLETFQSTPSAWRETTASSPKSSHMVPFQSTPSAWRETRKRRRNRRS